MLMEIYHDSPSFYGLKSARDLKLHCVALPVDSVFIVLSDRPMHYLEFYELP